MGREKSRNYFSRFMRTIKKNKAQKVRVRKDSSTSDQAVVHQATTPSLDWTKRPDVDRGQPSKHVLGMATKKDWKAGSYFVHMMFAQRQKTVRAKVSFDHVDRNQFYEGDNSNKLPLKELSPGTCDETTDNEWERTCEAPTPSYFDIFKPFESELSKPRRRRIHFLEQPELKKLSSSHVLPLVLPEPEPTTARGPIFRRILQTLYPCIFRSNERGVNENEDGEYSPGSSLPCPNFNLRVIDQIGWGGQGHVYLVQRGNGRSYVAKISYAQTTPIEMRKEFALMRSLKHRNIVSVFFEIPRGYLMAICETDLYTCVRSGKCNRRYSFHIAKRMFSAVRYIHSLKIAHLDIKPLNILLSYRGVPKLSDFGSAESFYSVSTNKIFKYQRDASGSIPYLSPEILDQKRYNAMNLIDSWALGGTLYFTVTNGTEPYGAVMDLDEMKRRIDEGELRKPRGYDAHLRASPKLRRLNKILMQLMDVSASNRLTVTEADERRW